MIEQFSALPLSFWIAAATLGGAIIGSFLNVVIYRLPQMLERRWEAEALAFLAERQGEQALPSSASSTWNLAFPASHCPHCRTRLRWYDNIPILSWLILRGRCRTCRQPIPLRYLLVEVLAATLAGAAIAHFGPTATGVAALLFLWMLLALAFIDWETQLLPDDLTLPLLWLGLLINVAELFAPLSQAVIGAAAGYLVLYALYWLFKWLTGKEGMGFGDFKLLAALGAWFGVAMLPEIILVSSLLGASVGVAARASGQLAAGQPIPFGPFLALGGVFVLFFPGHLLSLIHSGIAL